MVSGRAFELIFLRRIADSTSELHLQCQPVEARNGFCKLARGMMTSSGPPVVGVFNTSPDTVEMLRIVLEREGFVVVAAYTYDLRDSKVDLEALVRQHQPKVVIYDVAPPYDRNWRLFEHMRLMPALAGVRYVVTTTNVARVREVAGPDQELFELVGKPYDLDKIVAAVKGRLSAT